MEYHRYRPLQQGKHDIRLLEIEDAARQHSDTIYCSLINTAIAKLPDIYRNGARRKRYETLSYAWGPILADDAHLTDLIVCDGRPLMVTAHLNQGLKRYRENRHKWQSQPCKLLWVDAICIDQRETSEKSAQVRRMDQIYHNAQRTIVWLGELKSKDVLAGLTSAMGAMSADEVADPVRGSRQDLSGDELVAASSITESRWFHRRWVIQEYALSIERAFLIGSIYMPAKNMTDRLKATDLDLSLRRLDLRRTSVERHDAASVALEGTLLQRLHQFQGMGHSHPLDCVYALHSVSRDRHLIDIDYKITLRELNERVARLYVEDRATAWTLLACALQWRNPHYPSWLPDWTRTSTSLLQSSGIKSGSLPEEEKKAIDGIRPPLQRNRSSNSKSTDTLITCEPCDPSRTPLDWSDWGRYPPRFEGNQLTISAFMFWGVDIKPYTVERRSVYTSGFAFSKAYTDSSGRERCVLARPPFDPDSAVGKSMQCLLLLKYTRVALVMSKLRVTLRKDICKIVGVTGRLPLTFEWWERALRTEKVQTIVIE